MAEDAPDTAPEKAPDIVHSIEIRGSLDAVWAEVTKVGRRQRPMLDSVLDTTFVPGDPVYYRSVDGKRVFVVGRVVEYDPPRRFAHTFRLTMRDDPTSTIAWELESTPDGVRVTITQSGLPAEVKGREKVGATWVGVLADLKALFEQGEIRTKSKVTYALMRLFMPLMPKATRAANAHPEPRPTSTD